MASPFKLLKKHERELMVIMTGIAMFCFVILDSVTSGRRDGSSNPLVLPLIFAAVGAGVAWIHGQVAKKSANYWLNGLAIGAVAGAGVVFFSIRTEEGVQTSLGKISYQEIRHMQQNRAQANQVIDQVVMSREIPESQFRDQIVGMALQRFRFGGGSVREVLLNHLLIKEADRLNIQVPDEYVQQYLRDASEKKLTGQQFDEICRRAGMNDAQVFDLLREELRARIAYRVLSAEVVYLPEQYWQDYQKFNVKHSIDATAIPVQAFAKSVDAPQEGQLKAFFEEFKTKAPGGDQPGFRQPDRKRLAYFTASVEALEKEVGEPTDEQLKALYEERKEISFKETALPGKPEIPFGELDKPDASKPAEPAKPEDKVKSDEKPTEPAKDSKDSPPAKTEEKPKAEEPKANDPAKPDAAKPAESKEATRDKKPEVEKKSTEGGAECGAEDPKPTESVKTDTKPEEKPKAEEKAESPDAPKGAEKPQPAKTDAAAKEPAGKADATSKEQPAAYKPFDDVKDQLRDMWLSEKVQKLSKERLDAASSFIDELRKNAAKSDDLSKPEFVKEASAKAEEYAKARGLSYAETRLLDFKEFSEDKDIPLASAREPFDISMIKDFRNIPTPQPIPQHVFSGATALFIPESAEGGSGNQHFVYWIIEDVPEHEAKFEDPGIREQVEKAWRAKEARPKAEKRATELVEQVGKNVGAGKTGSLAEALTEVTVTGEKEGQQLSVISSAPFTWLRQSFAGLQSNPFGGRQIEFGTIPGIDNIDTNFMQTVAQMSVGDVKAIPNFDKSIYYVVHVKSRTPGGADDPAAAITQKQFIDEHPQMLFSVYDRLASSTFSDVQQKWFSDLMKKYAVDLAALDQF